MADWIVFVSSPRHEEGQRGYEDLLRGQVGRARLRWGIPVRQVIEISSAPCTERPNDQWTHRCDMM